MEQARQQLSELRRMASVTEEQFHGFVKTCEELKVPSVTVFIPEGDGDWYRMIRAYVLSDRTDAREHIWYFSPRQGLMVFDAQGENGVPFEQWDPQGNLFTDGERLFEGHTNMDPVEHQRRRS